MGGEAPRIIDIREPDGKSDADGNPATDNGAPEPNRKPEKLNGYSAVEPATVRIKRGNPNIGQWNKQRAAERRAAGPILREETAVQKTIEKISLTELLYSVHMMGAAMLDVPELELDKEESKKLGDAIKEVGKHYALEVDPKYVALANLGAVAGFLYGPRAIAYRARKNAAKDRKPAPALVDVPKPQAAPAPVPEAKVNGAAAARNRQMAPSELWPEPAGDFPGLG